MEGGTTGFPSKKKEGKSSSQDGCGTGGFVETQSEKGGLKKNAGRFYKRRCPKGRVTREGGTVVANCAKEGGAIRDDGGQKKGRPKDKGKFERKGHATEHRRKKPKNVRQDPGWPAGGGKKGTRPSLTVEGKTNR